MGGRKKKGKRMRVRVEEKKGNRGKEKTRHDPFHIPTSRFPLSPSLFLSPLSPPTDVRTYVYCIFCVNASLAVDHPIQNLSSFLFHLLD